MIYSRRSQGPVRVRFGPDAKECRMGLSQSPEKSVAPPPDAAAVLSFRLSLLLFFSRHRKCSWCVQSMIYSKGGRFGG